MAVFEDAGIENLLELPDSETDLGVGLSDGAHHGSFQVTEMKVNAGRACLGRSGFPRSHRGSGSSGGGCSPASNRTRLKLTRPSRLSRNATTVARPVGVRPRI